jgi:FkbM family methyltransferase
MFTNNDCPRGREIIFNHSFELCSMALWCDLVPTATTVVDIGAHVGVYSLATAALRQDIPIHAFEPNPAAYERLHLHKMVNNFRNIYEHRTALGNNDHVSIFSWINKGFDNISSGGHLVKKIKKSNTIDIPSIVKPFDTLSAGQDFGECPLFKIDVEGGELDVFMGMPNTLQRFRPNILLESFSSLACTRINEMTGPLGYRYFKIFENEGYLVENEGLIPATFDQNGNFNQLLMIDPPENVLVRVKS